MNRTERKEWKRRLELLRAQKIVEGNLPGAVEEMIHTFEEIEKHCEGQQVKCNRWIESTHDLLFKQRAAGRIEAMDEILAIIEGGGQ